MREENVEKTGKTTAVLEKAEKEVVVKDPKGFE